MNVKEKIKVYIKPDSWVAFLAARRLNASSLAIVFGHTIYLHKTTPDKFLASKRWVLHELKHVEQYERLGFLLFLYTYLKESLKNGYQRNALEIEARQAENEDGLWEKYKLIIRKPS